MISILKTIAAIATVVSAGKPTMTDEQIGAANLDTMTRLEHESQAHIIEFFDAKLFKQLVMSSGKKRPYDVVVLWTLPAKEAEERCKHCLTAERNLPKVVHSFEVDRRSSHHETVPRRVFFVIQHLDFGNNREMATVFTSKYKYTTIPWLSVQMRRDKPYSVGEPLVQPQHQWNVMPSEVATGPKLLNFVNKVLATDVEFKLTLSQLIYSNLVVCGVLLGFLLFIVLAYPLLVKPLLWFKLALAVTFVSIAGITYNMTNKPRPPKYEEEPGDPSKVKLYFARHTLGFQFQYEGYIFAAITLGAGLGLLFVTLAPKVTQNGIFIRVAAYSLLAAVFVAEAKLLDIYRLKAGSYEPSFWPKEGDLMKGSLAANQGNSI